mmetsp:Transcript_3330/g.4902  ORF Transcript_3330/g.4902 Transcript_3330/m.4902 type:complete len:203 (+) Transcript_3330:241-849(+)
MVSTCAAGCSTTTVLVLFCRNLITPSSINIIHALPRFFENNLTSTPPTNNSLSCFCFFASWAFAFWSANACISFSCFLLVLCESSLLGRPLRVTTATECGLCSARNFRCGTLSTDTAPGKPLLGGGIVATGGGFSPLLGGGIAAIGGGFPPFLGDDIAAIGGRFNGVIPYATDTGRIGRRICFLDNTDFGRSAVVLLPEYGA